MAIGEALERKSFFLLPGFLGAPIQPPRPVLINGRYGSDKGL